MPAFDSAVATVNDALPVLNEVRPYTPDVVGGLFNGFGGTTAGYYDANGRYTRISFQSNAYSLQGIGSLLPVPRQRAGPHRLPQERDAAAARAPRRSRRPTARTPGSSASRLLAGGLPVIRRADRRSRRGGRGGGRRSASGGAGERRYAVSAIFDNADFLVADRT